ncbi:hypothetical protein ES707_16266 [subsurface metagenome]
MPKNIAIDPLTVVPLSLELYSGSDALGSGTGFIIQHTGVPFLITNWHIVSGRNPQSGQPLSATGAIPDTIAIWYHIKGKLGTWSRRSEALKIHNGTDRWLEHPEGKKVDVVALPLTIDDEIQIYPLDLILSETDLLLSPSEPVSIIGFPFGLASGGKFPIWKTGHIASDIDINYNGLPAFIIDSTTKPGMSGAPVIARRIGMYRTSKTIQMGGQATRFVGIYSGRIHDQADIGIVWRPEIISAILP